jgi:hypothetical protein
MAAIRPTVLYISIVLLSSACAQKDPAFERGMKEWADKSCDCLMLPGNEVAECMTKVQEPTFPSHWADAMMDNPNYEVSEPFRKQVDGCQKAFAARDQNPGL